MKGVTKPKSDGAKKGAMGRIPPAPTKKKGKKKGKNKGPIVFQ